MTTTPDDGTAMRVTLRDVYDLVQETHTAVTEMRQTTALQQQEVTTVKLSVLDHETRIRGVERRVWALPSIATLVAVAGFALSVLGMIHSYGK